MYRRAKTRSPSIGGVLTKLGSALRMTILYTLRVSLINRHFGNQPDGFHGFLFFGAVRDKPELVESILTKITKLPTGEIFAFFCLLMKIIVTADLHYSRSNWRYISRAILFFLLHNFSLHDLAFIKVRRVRFPFRKTLRLNNFSQYVKKCQRHQW